MNIKAGKDVLAIEQPIFEKMCYLLTDGAHAQFDSRILFSWIGSYAKDTHENWIGFIEKFIESTGGEIDGVDMRLNDSNERFAMLNNMSGIMLILFSQMAMPSDLEPLDQADMALRYFKALLKETQRQLKKYHALPVPGLLERFLVDSVKNKTQEERSAKKEKKIGPEKRIEQAFGAQLEAQGITVQYQVVCKNGIADIVTPDTIYEIKATLTRSDLYKAMAQVLAYRACINPAASVVVVGCAHKREPVDFEIAQSLGIEVIVWEEKQLGQQKGSPRELPSS